jgi:chemotaxis protein methyltransferase CheR
VTLSNQQFDRTKHLALSLAGIELVERHRELLGRRGWRLGLPDSSAMDSLLDAVEKGDTAARQKFLGMLTTKFTGFFRHPRHFEIAAEHAIQAAEQRGRARLWCAAAATGEEPYSLAMKVIEVFRCDNPPVTILATDLDSEALATAQRGEYGTAALKGFEPSQQDRFLRETGASGRWAIAPAVHRLVQFSPMNLASVAWTVEGAFDVVFCRNVLMYLEACHRYAVLERLAALLAPEGLLMIDPTEYLGKARHLFTAETDAVYRSRRTSPPAAQLS